MHALGQVVDALEAAAPGRGGDVARPEQPFERAAWCRSIPTSRLPRSCARSRRPPAGLRADAREHRLGLGAPLAGEGAQAPSSQPRRARRAPSASAAGDAAGAAAATPHAPNIRTAAARFCRPRRPRRAGAVIGTEPREGRQIMGADQHVDAVDLVQREPVDGFRPTRGRPSPAAARRSPGRRARSAGLPGGKAFLLSSRGLRWPSFARTTAQSPPLARRRGSTRSRKRRWRSDAR